MEADDRVLHSIFLQEGQAPHVTNGVQCRLRATAGAELTQYPGPRTAKGEPGP